MSPCTFVGNAIICGPGQTYRRFYNLCPTCKRRRRFVARFDGAYYGETHMCCACGDRWQDGELCPRPVKRGWRKEAANTANRWWNEALSPRAYWAEVRALSDWED